MRELRVLTIPWDEGTGRFDDGALRLWLGTRELLRWEAALVQPEGRTCWSVMVEARPLADDGAKPGKKRPYGPPVPPGAAWEPMPTASEGGGTDGVDGPATAEGHGTTDPEGTSRRMSPREIAAEAARFAKSPPPDPMAGACELDRHRFLALVHWRREASIRAGVPAFVIAHDTMLAAVVRAMPRTLAALGEVRGIGAARIARYGRQILEVLHGSEPQGGPGGGGAVRGVDGHDAVAVRPDGAVPEEPAPQPDAAAGGHGAGDPGSGDERVVDP